MINEPVSIVGDSFQEVWLEVVRRLKASSWEIRNLVVQVRNPLIIDQAFHGRVQGFAEAEGLLGPKHVAYTIFPQGLCRGDTNLSDICTTYNRQSGVFERLQRKNPHSWGTYFRRMTRYRGQGGVVNQLTNIVGAIRSRASLSKAAYTIVIQEPGGETIRPLGGPCLNYVAVQAEPGLSGNPWVLGLLAVYRNHDFLERAYGNYWGLCNLLAFLAREAGGRPGPLTCVSSRAYAAGKKTALRRFMEEM